MTIYSWTPTNERGDNATLAFGKFICFATGLPIFSTVLPPPPFSKMK